MFGILSDPLSCYCSFLSVALYLLVDMCLHIILFKVEIIFLWQYDLVCDHSIFLSLAQSASWVTMLVCLPIAGYLSDKFGRRIIVGVGFVVNTLAALIVVFPKSFIVFIVCRLIFGMGSGIVNYLLNLLFGEFFTNTL